jgi:hypothetical protein
LLQNEGQEDLIEIPYQFIHNIVGSKLVRIWIKIHLNPNQNFGCVIESNEVWDSAKCLKLGSTDMSRSPSKRTDKRAGPSCREVISLQKANSLSSLFECNW